MADFEETASLIQAEKGGRQGATNDLLHKINQRHAKGTAVARRLSYKAVYETADSAASGAKRFAYISTQSKFLLQQELVLPKGFR